MSGFLIQGKFGNKGNFEAVVPNRTNSELVHFWRNNDDPRYTWSGPTPFGGSSLPYQGVSLIQSNFGSPGNLEIVAVTSNQLVHFWRDSGPQYAWTGPNVITEGVSGWPGLIQGQFGSKGNFEVVVPTSFAGILHLSRNNDDPTYPWSAPTLFAQNLGKVDGVSLIQSNFSSPGNLELAASAGGRVYHIMRDSGPAFQWSEPVPISDASGLPSLIQSRNGSRGNFELVVAGANGLNHYSRNNDVPLFPWSGPTLVSGPGGWLGSTPSLIQSNFNAPGNPGNLELLVLSKPFLWSFWRDSGPYFIWNLSGAGPVGVP